jgi:hypothetical protein
VFAKSERLRPIRFASAAGVSSRSSISGLSVRAPSYGGEVLTCGVLDQRELEWDGIVGVTAHVRRSRGEFGELRGAAPAFAGDQLEPFAAEWPDEHRLQHAALADRVGEPLERCRARRRESARAAFRRDLQRVSCTAVLADGYQGAGAASLTKLRRSAYFFGKIVRCPRAMGGRDWPVGHGSS